MGVGVGAWFVNPTNKEKQKRGKKNKTKCFFFLICGIGTNNPQFPTALPQFSRPHYGTPNGMQ